MAELALPPLVPFVVNAQAGQPGYRVSLKQLLQADHTLARVFSQHVVCRGNGRVEEGQSPADRWHKAGTGLELVETARVTQHIQGTVRDTKTQAALDLKAFTAEIRHAYHTLMM